MGLYYNLPPSKAIVKIIITSGVDNMSQITINGGNIQNNYPLDKPVSTSEDYNADPSYIKKKFLNFNRIYPKNRFFQTKLTFCCPLK